MSNPEMTTISVIALARELDITTEGVLVLAEQVAMIDERQTTWTVRHPNGWPEKYVDTATADDIRAEIAAQKENT